MLPARGGGALRRLLLSTLTPNSIVSMPDRIRCHVENAVVRSEQRETLDDLIYKMFKRRHHDFVGGQEKDWLRVELVQSLRQASQVYRDELSTKTEGPLPFALGYFQRREDSLELVSEQIPANVAPKSFVCLLSEFLEPGAQFWFSGNAGEEGWEVRGSGDVRPLSASAEQGDYDQSGEASS